jgi:hypothetical protein
MLELAGLAEFPQSSTKLPPRGPGDASAAQLD